jgi:hypothetical protein
MQAFRYFVLSCLLLATPIAKSSEALLNSLTSQLGISTEQAAGGAGALFNLAKSRLASEEFSQIAAAVPNVDELIAAAPALTESSANTAAVASMLGGESGLGSLAVLASSFSQLGLSSEMIGQFTPILLDYLQQAGDSKIMEIMKGALAM